MAKKKKGMLRGQLANYTPFNTVCDRVDQEEDVYIPEWSPPGTRNTLRSEARAELDWSVSKGGEDLYWAHMDGYQWYIHLSKVEVFEEYLRDKFPKVK